MSLGLAGGGGLGTRLGTRLENQCRRVHSDCGLKTRKPPASRRFSSGETRTRTGDTTIFSRGSTTGECGPFPATTRGAVAGLRAHTFPRFPHDCGVFGRRFSDLCLNSFAAERAQPGGVPAFAVRAQSRPLGPLRPGEL